MQAADDLGDFGSAAAVTTDLAYATKIVLCKYVRSCTITENAHLQQQLSIKGSFRALVRDDRNESPGSHASSRHRGSPSSHSTDNECTPRFENAPEKLLLGKALEVSNACPSVSVLICKPARQEGKAFRKGPTCPHADFAFHRMFSAIEYYSGEPH